MWITKTHDGYYCVRWYVDGKRKQKNFKTKTEAKKFGAALELTPEEKSSTITVESLMRYYQTNVTPTKKGEREEYHRINRLMRYAFVKKTLSQITSKDIERYMEQRLQERTARTGGGLVSPSTVYKERTTLSAIFTHAVKQGLMSTNPVKGTSVPDKGEARERVASEEEIKLINTAANWDGESVPVTKTQLVAAAFSLACRTGMRSGEMLSIEKVWIDGQVIHLPKEATKTESRRDVALSKDARRILDLILERGDEPKIFGDMTSVRKEALWRKIRNRAGLGAVYDSQGRLVQEGLNFHDARATFCTWAASPDPKTGAPRLDVLSLAKQTGHKNLAMLQRYYRATAQQIAQRLG